MLDADQLAQCARGLNTLADIDVNNPISVSTFMAFDQMFELATGRPPSTAFTRAVNLFASWCQADYQARASARYSGASALHWYKYQVRPLSFVLFCLSLYLSSLSLSLFLSLSLSLSPHPCLFASPPPPPRPPPSSASLATASRSRETRNGSSRDPTTTNRSQARRWAAGSGRQFRFATRTERTQ